MAQKIRLGAFESLCTAENPETNDSKSASEDSHSEHEEILKRPKPIYFAYVFLFRYMQ